MAYVPSYQHDVFVSFPMEAQNWTEQFVAALMTVDTSRLIPIKDRLEIYFAKDKWRQGQISTEMLEAASRSALFLVVLTKDSVSQQETRFFQREMEAFRQSGSPKRRFYPIPLCRVEGTELRRLMPPDAPDEFWSTNLEFYEEVTGVAIPFRPSHPSYETRVLVAASDIRELLDNLKRARDEQAQAEKHGYFSGISVLLAPIEKESVLEEDWKYIRNQLKSDGVTLFTEEPAGNGAFDFEAGLQKANLFVQLLDLRDAQDSAKRQLDAFKAHESTPLLRWRAPIRNRELPMPAHFDGAEVGTPIDFANTIRAKLKELKEAKRPPPPKPIPDLRPYLYIAADTPDRKNALKLQAAARKHILADIMKESNGLGEDRKQDFDAALEVAKVTRMGIVFLYGEAEPTFVEDTISFYTKQVAVKLQKDPTALYTRVYLAPHKKSPVSGSLSLPFEVETCGRDDEFILDPVDQIIGELSGDRT